MGSVTACAPEPGERRSRIVGKRVESDSLSRHQSLRNSRDFRRVLSDGNRRRSGGIVMVSSPGQTGPPRLGLLVSRSCGGAVERNRIKRRLRSAADTVELQPGIDYVIIATSTVAHVPFGELTEWLSRALETSANA